MTELQQYTGQDGRNVFAKWFEELNVQAAAKVTAALEKIALGNFSNVEPVGEGVSEYKVDWGPGYCIYVGKDGELLVICSAAARRSGSRLTSLSRKRTGRNTRSGSGGVVTNNGIDK